MENVADVVQERDDLQVGINYYIIDHHMGYFDSSEWDRKILIACDPVWHEGVCVCVCGGGGGN